MNDRVLPPSFWTVSKHEIIIPDNPVPKIWVSLGGRGAGRWPSLASPKPSRRGFLWFYTRFEFFSNPKT